MKQLIYLQLSQNTSGRQMSSGLLPVIRTDHPLCWLVSLYSLQCFPHSHVTCCPPCSTYQTHLLKWGGLFGSAQLVFVAHLLLIPISSSYCFLQPLVINKLTCQQLTLFYVCQKPFEVPSPAVWYQFLSPDGPVYLLHFNKVGAAVLLCVCVGGGCVFVLLGWINKPIKAPGSLLLVVADVLAPAGFFLSVVMCFWH